MPEDLKDARIKRTEELFLLCQSEKGRDDLLMTWLEHKRKRSGCEVAPPNQMNWAAMAKEIIEMEFDDVESG